eukprot:CAMPEP_0194279480 /NCGR_PEP_ID=MMETSP0169-20130528/13952_1 /TAXON_ID=218684 /ORGANISM="Corethron pennatum, Strain L29A3" /LENGTH=585 /DNA_ID=CAMNT_0039023907 /DNA_START=220 /DNA_END=1977 /DNA_ORIENTATION=+
MSSSLQMSETNNDRPSGAQRAILTTTNAAWMSGKWGVGYRFPGGRWLEQDRKCGKNGTYPVEPLLDQITSGFIAGTGPSWLIIGLSQGAAGDTYTSLHPVLTGLDDTNGTLYTPSRDGAADHFETILRYVKKNSDLKVIAYLATEGPAKLKHGYTRAYDYVRRQYVACPYVQDTDPGKCTAAMRVWIDAVHGWYGTTDDSDRATLKATLHRAYAEKIVRPYVQKFAGRVDGYWFDHAETGDVDLLDAVIGEEDPKAAIAFNTGQNVPLTVNSPGREDYTGGHPLPLKYGPPSRQENEVLVTSIERTSDGYIRKNPPDNWYAGYDIDQLTKIFEADGRSEKMLPSLGHLFMPSSDNSWNGVGAKVGWNDPLARMWMGRVLEGGGSWTWNVPRQKNNGCIAASTLDERHVEFMRRVADIRELRRCIAEAKRETPNKKEHMQNLVKEDRRRCRKLPKLIRKECHKSNKRIFKTLLAKVFTGGVCEIISDVEDREKCEDEKNQILYELANKAYRARVSDCARDEQMLWREGRNDRLRARSKWGDGQLARWRMKRDAKLSARLEWSKGGEEENTDKQSFWARMSGVRGKE